MDLRALFLTGAFVAPLAIAACGGDAGPGAFQADFKTNGGFFTQTSSRTRGSSPHGTQQTWYSNDLKDLVAQASFTAPVGAVAIKEFDTMNDGTADAFAVRVKREAGYDTANNDWYYELRGLDGMVLAVPPAGKTQVCIDCHKSFAATDFLAGTKLR